MALRRVRDDKPSVALPVQDESKLPYFPITELPSKFMAYPEGLAVSYRRYGWLEMKVLSQRRGTLSLRDQVDIVMRGIKFSGVDFDPMSITFPDYTFLGLCRKVATIAPPAFDLRYTCSKCSKISSFSIPVSALEFENMDVPAARAEVQLEGILAVFQPLTLGRFVDMCDQTVQYPEEELEMTWAYSCVSHDPQEIIRYFREEATPNDSRLMNRLDKMFYHGLKPVRNVCRNNIITVVDTGEFNRLNSRLSEELRKELHDKGHKFSANRRTQDLEAYMEEARIITRERCGQETELSLDGGEGLIVPFRRAGRNFEDAVHFSSARQPAD